MSIRKAYVWLLAAALPLAACGGGGDEPTAAPAAKPAAAATAGKTGSSTVTGKVPSRAQRPKSRP